MNQKIEVNTFSDPEIESKLQECCDNVQVYERKGKQDASIHPLTEEYWKTVVYLPLLSELKNTIALIQQRTTPVTNALTTQNLLTGTSEQSKSLLADIKELKIKEVKVQMQLKAIPYNHLKIVGRWLVYITVAFISCIDGYISYDAMSSIGIPDWLTVLLAIIIASAIFVGSKLVAQYALKARNKFIRSCRYLMAIGFATILFTFLNEQRAGAINSAANEYQQHSNAISTYLPDISSLGMTVLSVSLFITALFFVSRVLPTEAEAEMELKRNAKKKELSQITKAIKNKDKEFKSLIDEAQRGTIETNSKCEYALSAKNRAIAIAEESLQAYAKSYLLHSSASIVPNFFSNPPHFNV